MGSNNKKKDMENQNIQDQNIQDPRQTGVKGLKGLAFRKEYKELPKDMQRRMLYSKIGVNPDELLPATKTSNAYIRHINQGMPIRQEVGFVGLGESKLDKMINTPRQLEDLANFRGELQSGLEQITHGVAKGVILAGTTFLEGTVGLAIGVGNGLVNGFGEGQMWNTEFNHLLMDINDMMEEALPNYYTNREKDMNLWQQMGTANFWGDKFIKNLGFTVGAFYSGGVFSAALKATRLPALIKMMAGRGTSKVVSTLLGSTVSAYNEGSIEAIHVYRNFKKSYVPYIENTYNQRKKEIEERFKDYPNSIYKDLALEKLEIQREEALKKVEADAIAAGNVALGWNMPILTASNAFMFGKIYANGFRTANRAYNLMRRSVATTDGRVGSIMFDPSITRTGKSLKTIGNAMSEGTEEGLQKLASTYATEAYAQDMADYFKSGWNNTAYKQAIDYSQAFSDALQKTLGDKGTWEEVFIGGLTGLLGMPSFRSARTSSGSWQSPIYFQGGMFNAGKEYKEEYARQKAIAGKLNERVNDPDFKKGLIALTRHFKYQNDMDNAVRTGDNFLYKNAEFQQLMNDVIMFDAAGQLKYLEEMVKNSFDGSPESLNAVKEYLKKEITMPDGSKATVAPFKDEHGNDMSDDEIINHIESNKQSILDAIRKFKKAKNELDMATKGVLSDEHLTDLAVRYLQVDDWISRAKSLGVELMPLIRESVEYYRNSYNDEKERLGIIGSIMDENNVQRKNLSEENRKKLEEQEEKLAIMEKNLKTLDDIMRLPEKKLKNVLSMEHGIAALVSNYETLKEITGQTVSPEEKQNVDDFFKITEAIEEYNNKLQEYIANPRALADRLDSQQREAEQEFAEEQSAGLMESLRKAKTPKEFADIYNNSKESEEVKRQVLDTLKNEKNPMYIEYRKRQAAINYLRNIVESKDKDGKDLLSPEEKARMLSVIEKLENSDASFSGYRDLFLSDNDFTLYSYLNRESGEKLNNIILGALDYLGEQFNNPDSWENPVNPPAQEKPEDTRAPQSEDIGKDETTATEDPNAPGNIDIRNMRAGQVVGLYVNGAWIRGITDMPVEGLENGKHNIGNTWYFHKNGFTFYFIVEPSNDVIKYLDSFDEMPLDYNEKRRILEEAFKIMKGEVSRNEKENDSEDMQDEPNGGISKEDIRKDNKESMRDMSDSNKEDDTEQRENGNIRYIPNNELVSVIYEISGVVHPEGNLLNGVKREKGIVTINGKTFDFNSNEEVEVSENGLNYYLVSFGNNSDMALVVTKVPFSIEKTRTIINGLGLNAGNEGVLLNAVAEAIKQEASPKKKERWIPIINYYDHESYDNGKTERLDKVKPAFQQIFDYLLDGFNFVDEGGVKNGDMVDIVISPAYERIKTYNNDVPTLFMRHRESGKIIGSLPEASGAIDRYAGMRELVDKVRVEWERNKATYMASDDMRFVKQGLTVTNIYKGKIEFQDESRPLKDVIGDESSRGEVVIGVVRNGNLMTSDNNISPDQIVDNKLRGTIYMLVPNGYTRDNKRTYFPVMLEIGRFSRKEGFSSYEEAQRQASSNPVVKNLLNYIDKIANILNKYEGNVQDDLRKLVRNFNNVLFIKNISVEIVERYGDVYLHVNQRGEEKGQRNDKYIKVRTQPSVSIEIGTDTTNNESKDIPAEAVSKEEISKNLFDALLEYDLPFMVDYTMISDKGYINDLIESGVLRTFMVDGKSHGAWFALSPFNQNGNRNQDKEKERAVPMEETGSNPVGGTESAIPGVKVYFASKDFYVDGDVVRDSEGQEVEGEQALVAREINELNQRMAKGETVFSKDEVFRGLISWEVIDRRNGRILRADGKERFEKEEYEFYEEQDFKKLDENSTITDIQEFLDSYMFSKYEPEAINMQNSKDKALWEKALNTDTKEAYEAYLRDTDMGEYKHLPLHGSEARERIQALEGQSGSNTSVQTETASKPKKKRKPLIINDEEVENEIFSQEINKNTEEQTPTIDMPQTQNEPNQNEPVRGVTNQEYNESSQEEKDKMNECKP